MGSMVNAIGSAQAADYKKEIARYNQSIANRMAGDALAEGSAEAEAMKLRGGRIKAAATAAAANSGVDVASATPAEVRATTAGMTALDVARIKNQAARRAFGYRTQATQFEMEAHRAIEEKRLAIVAAGVSAGSWVGGAWAGGSAGGGGGADLGANQGFEASEYPSIGGGN